MKMFDPYQFNCSCTNRRIEKFNKTFASLCNHCVAIPRLLLFAFKLAWKFYSNQWPNTSTEKIFSSLHSFSFHFANSICWTFFHTVICCLHIQFTIWAKWTMHQFSSAESVHTPVLTTFDIHCSSGYVLCTEEPGWFDRGGGAKSYNIHCIWMFPILNVWISHSISLPYHSGY